MQEIQDVPTLLTDTSRSFTLHFFRPGSFPVGLVLAAGMASVIGCNRGHSADVVATVNGHAIMRTEMDKNYQAQLGEAPQQRQLPQEQAGRRTTLCQVANAIRYPWRAGTLHFSLSSS